MPEPRLIHLQVEFRWHQCSQCGRWYATQVGAPLIDCPHGCHSANVRKELEQRVASAHQRIDEMIKMERTLAALRGVITKLQRKITYGR